jgi:uncharacterized protein
MRKEEVLERLKAHRDDLKEMGVRSLALFGSVARGEERAESDIDILIEYTDAVGLFEFIEIKHRLEEILGAPVDLVSRRGLKARLRDEILREAVDAA